MGDIITILKITVCFGWHCISFSRGLPEFASCQILALPARFGNIPIAWGFQQNSPYLAIFDYYIRLMQESGSQHKIENDFAGK